MTNKTPAIQVFGIVLFISLTTFIVAGCEEVLPPRNDPQDFLEVSFTGESGSILLGSDLAMTPPQQFPGRLVIRLKNVHDEVLQAEEDIDIQATFWLQSNPGTAGSASGGRDQLVDPFMIHHPNLLTIEPESTAVFQIQWNHGSERLWESTSLTFHRLPGNPIDITWFESNPIDVVADGTAKFFKNIEPVELEQTSFVLTYLIFVADPVPVTVDSLIAQYDPDPGSVSLTWQTPREVGNYGFRVEKGIDGVDFPYSYPDFILGHGQGFNFDTTYYSYLDSLEISGGLWYYRLQRWYDFGFMRWQVEPTEPVVVLIP